MKPTAQQFRDSLAADRPPAHFDAPHLALWRDAKGEWEQAHTCVDALNDEPAIRVHAYLHRKEGDFANAAHWYRRVGRTAPDQSLTAEFESLLNELLET